MAAIDPAPLAGRRVLVVEDEYFLADDVVRALESAGATTLGPLNDTDLALRLAQEEADLDAAILDINVRGATTFAVAEELKRRAVPFVFATGYDQAAIPPAYGEVPRWEKPFDPAALARSLPALMRGREPGRADRAPAVAGMPARGAGTPARGV